MIAAQGRATARYALPRRNVTTKKVSTCREPTRGGQATGQRTSQGNSIHQATVYVAVMVYHQHQRSTVYDAIIVYHNYDAVMVNHQQQAFYLL